MIRLAPYLFFAAVLAILAPTIPEAARKAAHDVRMME
jgi:hypothetical protein